jgi:hypothetical protein
MFTIKSAPASTACLTMRSTGTWRAMNDHAFLFSERHGGRDLLAARSGQRRAYGSRNTASSRSVSRARNTATQRAVSVMSRESARPFARL